jgi:DNA-binding transcriptional LysR family regulator
MPRTAVVKAHRFNPVPCRNSGRLASQTPRRKIASVDILRGPHSQLQTPLVASFAAQRESLLYAGRREPTQVINLYGSIKSYTRSHFILTNIPLPVVTLSRGLRTCWRCQFSFRPSNFRGLMTQKGRGRFNVPMEIIRSVAAIQETGSITKAANLLGLSQPAISAQVKRIEGIVGGSIFRKTPNGSAATELGKLVLSQAHKILEANDQLVFLRSASANPEAVRLGVDETYTKTVLACLPKAERSKLTIYADCSAEISKALANGYIDIAIFLSASDAPQDSSFGVVSANEKELAWVRSRDFVLSPGAPIPLVTWPGQVGHALMIESLERSSMLYRLAFTSPDVQSALDATAAGVGLLSMIKDFVPASLMVANEYYLPRFKPITLFLAARSGLRRSDLVDRLSMHLIQRATAESIAP